MRRSGRRGAALLALAVAITLVGAQSASATFHLIHIREVYPGSAADPLAEYVELQMYASGQEFVAGHVVRTYDASGSLVKTNTIDSNVANGASQRTVLLATPQAEAQFGVQADAPLAPSGQLSPAGGAVCWESLDCVSWGSFSKSTLSASGSPADPLGIPDGMALRRTIAPRCPTLLEEADDTNDSASDFADAFPAPRPNSAVPAERACSSGQGPPAGGGGTPGGGSPGADNHTQPQTLFRQKPGHQIRDRTPTFRFVSSIAGSTYLCKLDGRSFKRCRSPFTAPRLNFGRHVFKVKARSPDGTADLSPATYSFKIVRP